jgi:hypothetical protein
MIQTRFLKKYFQVYAQAAGKYALNFTYYFCSHIDSAEFLNYIDISLKIFGFFMRKADSNSQICELCCLLSMAQFYIV